MSSHLKPKVTVKTDGSILSLIKLTGGNELDDNLTLGEHHEETLTEAQ